MSEIVDLARLSGPSHDDSHDSSSFYNLTVMELYSFRTGMGVESTVQNCRNFEHPA